MVIWSTFLKGDSYLSSDEILDTFTRVREDYSNQNHDLYERNVQLLFAVTVGSSEDNFLDIYMALTF